MSYELKFGKDIHVLDARKGRDLSADLLGPDGVPRVVPADFYWQTTPEERAVFCNRNAVYGLITQELVDFLIQKIGGRTAIEIGAGNGALARALGIPATDNRMQEEPAIKAHYAACQQPTITYGSDVEKLDALAAIAKHKPQVVIACWVTHLYREDRSAAGGNSFGVNEEAVIAGCEDYIFIGNSHVHAGKSIWNLPHQKIMPDWLYSRAMNGTSNFIAIWHGGKHPMYLD